MAFTGLRSRGQRRQAPPRGSGGKPLACLFQLLCHSTSPGSEPLLRSQASGKGPPLPDSADLGFPHRALSSSACGPSALQLAFIRVLTWILFWIIQEISPFQDPPLNRVSKASLAIEANISRWQRLSLADAVLPQRRHSLFPLSSWHRQSGRGALFHFMFFFFFFFFPVSALPVSIACYAVLELWLWREAAGSGVEKRFSNKIPFCVGVLASAPSY